MRIHFKLIKTNVFNSVFIVMRVKYLGNSSFLVKSKETKLITNPLDLGVSEKLHKIMPNIVVLSHKVEIPPDSYYIVSSPGEFEVRDIFIHGYTSQIESDDPSGADIFMIDIENVHFGFIDKKVTRVSEDIVDEMGIVNVLLVSLAENMGMKLNQIVDLINRIEPQIVVPMDFTKEFLESCAKVMGVKEMEKLPYLDVKFTDFTEEDVATRLVMLEK
jgi:L-ascorbate metabolism protein UlaG (beta-lactamase superfamily)